MKTHNHHSHHGHHHDHPASYHMLVVAICITLAFAAVEALAGWWSGSLALLGDAGHMASDVLSMGIAAFAAWVALSPPSAKHSYGLGRAEVLAAWFSSLLMLLVSIAVIVEAVKRLSLPIHVNARPVILVASLGILINLFIAWLLMKSERTLNIRAALLHVIGDLLGAMAALASGIVVYFTRWTLIDPILSIFIACLIMFSSFRLLRESFSILMEGVPAHLDIQQVSQTMTQLKGVKTVHDLHIWTLSSGTIALSAHVDIDNMTVWENVFTEMKAMLKRHYNIDHITLQPEQTLMDCEACTNQNL